jgi:protein tyrosine/serine phosphatase
MLRNRLLLRAQLAAALMLLPALQAYAGPPAPADLASIHIPNFGQISDTYFRGSQPQDADYQALARLGIRTVLDLQRDGREDERRLVEAAGMTFVRIPLTTTDRPSDAAVAEFLKIVNDPSRQPVYVHCAGGRHRTGVMTAVYRMTTDHWSAEQAYAEMKQFKFEGFPGHPTLKRFVYDFYTQLKSLAPNPKQIVRSAPTARQAA